MTLIQTRTVNGIECEIHATAGKSGGHWSVLRGAAGPTLGTAETLDAALSAASRAIRKTRVEVDVAFVLADGTRGIATGFHGQTGAVLVTLTDGTRDSLDHQTASRALRADTPGDVVTRIGELEREAAAATRTARDLRKAHALDVRSSVKRAIDAAVPA